MLELVLGRVDSWAILWLVIAPMATEGARCDRTCSLAIRLAFVSRAKRGKLSCLAGENGVSGAGVEVLSGILLYVLVLNIAFGAPRPTGCLTYLDSTF